MADIVKAQRVFDQICRYFDSNNWRYERNDGLVLRTGFNGEDIPMQLIIQVNPDLQLIRLFSFMPFEMEQSKRIEGCLAACAATFKLADGCFICDLEDGSVRFVLTTYFIDGEISDNAIDYMLRISLNTIDQYNDKFDALNNGTMSIDEFIQFVNA